MEIQVIMNNVISLFLIILVGVYGVKRNIISKEIQDGLIDLLMDITLPLLVINSFSMSFDDEMKGNLWRCLLYSALVFIIVGIISYILLIPIKDKDKKRVLQFANVFSNCGFVGFPLINNIYGAEGVVYTSIFNMFFNILVWTYGVMLYTDKINIKDMKKVLLTPGIISVFIGLPLLIFDVQLPDIIYNSFELVGGMTTPLSMIIIGCILAKVDLKSAFKDITVYYEIAIRLLIIPIFLIVIAKVVGENNVLINTMIILEAMPAATMTSIMADKYSNSSDYSAIIVFSTTLFSLITFPLILQIIS
ncbi:AEC family transporter [uncultured Clostridium sp.]|uniref:AEC family transporter n=1 Tax=uncultured Clostridium sp. TaxID=59620 RepID=UPI0025FDECD9|nr:AEC family transporter [uncultured Clostridium sp.]